MISIRNIRFIWVFIAMKACFCFVFSTNLCVYVCAWWDIRDMKSFWNSEEMKCCFTLCLNCILFAVQRNMKHRFSSEVTSPLQILSIIFIEFALVPCFSTHAVRYHVYFCRPLRRPPAPKKGIACSLQINLLKSRGDVYLAGIRWYTEPIRLYCCKELA